MLCVLAWLDLLHRSGTDLSFQGVSAPGVKMTSCVDTCKCLHNSMTQKAYKPHFKIFLAPDLVTDLFYSKK